MSESSELIPEMDLSAQNPFVQPPVTGGHAGAGSAPGLVFPAPSSVQQFNVFAPQYSVELHITQMRTETRELEAHAERRHKQHILTYQEAAAVGLANVEERAEKNHLEAMAELQAALATSEYRAVNRENTLLAELRDQNDELQERLDSAERALERALEQAHPATPKGQPAPAPGTPSQNPFAVPKAPTAPLFATADAIPQSARNLFESMNPGGVTATPIFPGTPTAGPFPSVTAPPAAGLGAPSSDVLSTGLLEAQMAILSKLRDMKGEAKEDSSKPKVKEAETINCQNSRTPNRTDLGRQQQGKQLEQPLTRLTKLLSGSWRRTTKMRTIRPSVTPESFSPLTPSSLLL